MVIDASRCVGCYNCFLACRDEHVGNDHHPVAIAQPETGQAWIEVREQERGSFPKVKVSYVPVPCLHCVDAPCIAAAKDGAVYRRDDGIVLIDPKKAVGQRELVSACPYRAIFWNEKENVAQKCTLCAHLLDGGEKAPRCAEACPTQAIVFGDTSDSKNEISKLRAARPVEQLQPARDLEPLVGYRGLPKRFVAGEVVFADKQQTPAESVAVSLRRRTQVLTAVTDNYGDFEFDGLEADAEYVLSVAHSGYRPRQLTLSTHHDINLGPVMLDPS